VDYEGGSKMKEKSRNMNEGMRIKLRKTVPLWVVILIIVSLSSVVVAVDINVLPIEHISLWSGTTASSNFTIQDQIVHFHGPNKVVIKLTLLNTNTAASIANVTVFIENSSGNNIMNVTNSTGSVIGGSTVNMNFDFNSTGITAEYATDFIEIMDT
jgi:hypothetical protein